VTSHVFRKTAATELDRDGLSARVIADQLGHANVSMTQDRYLGRQAVTSDAADALDRAHREATRDRGDRVSGP
jgi:integrase